MEVNMVAPLNVEQCSSFIHCNLQAPGPHGSIHEAPHRRWGITLSRQSGCGAHVVAERVAELLQAHTPAEAPPWTVYDRNLVEKVLEEHHLPGRLARFMPEDRVHGIDDVMDEIFGLHPPVDTLIRQTTETVLHLADRGDVIILGRGANILTAGMPKFLHVRLVGSLERRIGHMQHFEGLDRKAAAERIHNEDRGRERYLQRHFSRSIEDSTLYHVVLNTDLLPVEEMAQLISDLARRRLRNGAVAHG
jgi:cytidylate kinase